MTGWRTSISLQPFVQTRLECGSVLYTSISLHPVFQTCPDCGSLFRTRMSIQLCVQNIFGSWFRVGVQASVYSPSIKHIWTVVPCLRTRIVSIPVFQTFGLWFRVSVQASVSGVRVHKCVSQKDVFNERCTFNLSKRPSLTRSVELFLFLFS